MSSCRHAQISVQDRGALLSFPVGAGIEVVSHFETTMG